MKQTLYFNADKLWVVSGASAACRLPLVPSATPVETIASDHGAIALVDNCLAPPSPAAIAIDLRAFFDIATPDDYTLAARAFQWLNWRRTTRFCAACGQPLQRDPLEAAMVCPACRAQYYPRINPVVIVRITRGDTILLARRASGPFKLYSVIAGFVEAGETLEQALHREVAEEIGITIKNIRYFSSQPWSFPNNLMIGFTAEWAEGAVHPDGVEIGEADWFRPDNLPPLPGPISIARQMINAWLADYPGTCPS